MGNRTKYSKAIVAKICGYLASGLNLKQSAAAAGICENTLASWRKLYPDFAAKVESAREQMRAKVLAQILEAGKSDWRALAEHLRLSFPELRYGNGPSVNVAIQQNNMAVSDAERERLIKMREDALNKAAAKPAEPLQLEDASDPRAIAEKAEATLAQPQEPPKQLLLPKPKPMTIVDRAETQAARMKREGWQAAEDCVDFDDILDGY